MTALSPSAVAAGLGLPDGLSPWLEELERVGPPAGGVPLPRGEDAARLLGRLRVAGPDAAAIAGALPDPDGSPELWWLLERSYQQLRSVIGDPDAMVWPPSLPSALDAAGRCFWVFVLMALAGDVRRWHGEQGIPDEVSWSTLADLGRHVARYRRRHGAAGLASQGWLGLHSRGGLYELGRLQFNPYRLRTGMAGPLFWYEGGEAAARGPGFQPGDPVLGVHVPEGAPLAPERCDESFLAARSFFRRHLPARAGRVATCTSSGRAATGGCAPAGWSCEAGAGGPALATEATVTRSGITFRERALMHGLRVARPLQGPDLESGHVLCYARPARTGPALPRRRDLRRSSCSGGAA